MPSSAKSQKPTSKIHTQSTGLRNNLLSLEELKTTKLHRRIHPLRGMEFHAMRLFAGLYTYHRGAAVTFSGCPPGGRTRMIPDQPDPEVSSPTHLQFCAHEYRQWEGETSVIGLHFSAFTLG